MMKELKIQTSQGAIHVYDSGGDGPPVVFIHGNSTSGKIFTKQFKALGTKYRLLAPDLPGHGNSDTAKDIATYSLPGYAQLLHEVLQKMDVTHFTLIGWSLGGHIALEMVHRNPHINGILIAGTPPIPLTREGVQKGFKQFEGAHLGAYPGRFTKEQAECFVAVIGIDLQKNGTDFIIEDAIKTDGNARVCMMNSMLRGYGVDQTNIVRSMKIPLAIVASENDQCVNNAYIIHEVGHALLWRTSIQIIPHAGHAALWEYSDCFNQIVLDFLRDLYH